MIFVEQENNPERRYRNSLANGSYLKEKKNPNSRIKKKGRTPQLLCSLTWLNEHPGQI